MTKPIRVILSADTRAILARLADERHCSMSKMVEFIVQRWARRKRTSGATP